MSSISDDCNTWEPRDIPKGRRLFYNEACDVLELFQSDGFISEGDMPELRERIVEGQEALFNDMRKQVKLQIRQQQEYRRRTMKRSPHRADMIREQDTAIHALQQVLKRFDKIAGPEITGD